MFCTHIIIDHKEHDGCGVGLCVSWREPVMGSCKRGTEHSGCIQCGNFIHCLSNRQILKRGSSPWSQRVSFFFNIQCSCYSSTVLWPIFGICPTRYRPSRQLSFYKVIRMSAQCPTPNLEGHGISLYPAPQHLAQNLSSKGGPTID